MAFKIRKREKIIAGTIVGVAAIAAVHMLMFQKKIERYQRYQVEYRRKRDDASRIGKMPTAKEQQDYRQATESDANLYWRSVFEMGLVWPVYFFQQQPIEAKKEDDKKKGEEEKKEPGPSPEELNALRDKAYQIAAETALITRLERLMEQKAAYESGKPWPSDAMSGAEGGLTGKLNLSFLGSGDPAKTGKWNLPGGLSKKLQDSAKLSDEVVRLFQNYSLLKTVTVEGQDQQGAAYFNQLRREYERQLKELGVDLNLLGKLSQISSYLPEFVRLMQARLIWRSRGDQGTFVVRKDAQGGTTEVTFNDLRNMFQVGLPTNQSAPPKEDDEEAPQGVAGLAQETMSPYAELIYFNAQLHMLERILPIARKNGIEQIERVDLPKYSKLVHYKKPKQEEEDSGSKRRGRRGRRSEGPSEDFAMEGMPGAAPASSDKPAGTPPHDELGMANLIGLVYVGSNEASMRFMRDLTLLPEYLRLHMVRIESLPPEGSKIRTTLYVERMVTKWDVSYPGNGVLNAQTGLPEPIISRKHSLGLKYLAQQQAEEKRLGLDTSEPVENALKENDLWDKVPYGQAIEAIRQARQEAQAKAPARKAQNRQAAAKAPAKPQPAQPQPPGAQPAPAQPTPGEQPPQPAASPAAANQP